ncbi:transcription factor TGA9-like isoform X2 [Benincasa hispida]|uniref:transcription factor TGA9-like isoform X2 n=1 Tax=Benincasa hispida TaxID=102211 RepID=UPI0018FF4C8E|nr:transcription factor TGA9-like isoform X2 [Benincasa hispida]
MGSQRVEETVPSSTHHHHHHLPYNSLLYGINNNNLSSTLINHDGQSFDFGELEQAIVLQGLEAKNYKLDHHEPKQSKPAATLEMFPSWPIKYQQTSRGISLRRREESTDESGSAVNTHTISKSNHHHHYNQEGDLELEIEQEESDQMSKKGCSSSCSSGQDQCFIQKHLPLVQPEQMFTDISTTALSSQHQSLQQKRKGCGSISTSQKQLDAKTLRRLAQNREAARKSRLRKKAYVQQLESSRIKLTQLEQDLHRARSQGLFLGACGTGGGIVSPGSAMFDMEYVRWLEEEHRHTVELRGGLEACLPDVELRVRVDACISHYDQIFRLKGEAAKSDIFHLITGIWMSPAERCFIWIGGFRPSDLIKMLMSQLDPITEQQVMEIYKLQHSSQQAEDALSQGLDQLHQSLTDSVAGGPVIDGINHMVLAMDKLSSLQGFLHQADILRQQMLHQLRRILTIRQAARCFLVIGEYYSRLRALSSLWSSRPKEGEDNSCQTSTHHQGHMVQPLHHRFSSF